jgi:G3E family GTPase
MKARSRLRLIAPAASLVLETTFGRVDYREIFSRRYDSSLINSKSGKRSSGISTAGFGAICFVSNSPISEPALLQLYRKHRDKIVRSKGFIVTEKGTAELQLSGSVIEIKPAQNAIQRTELVLIVREQDKELLEDEFKKVFAGKGE